MSGSVNKVVRSFSQRAQVVAYNLFIALLVTHLALPPQSLLADPPEGQNTGSGTAVFTPDTLPRENLPKEGQDLLNAFEKAENPAVQLAIEGANANAGMLLTQSVIYKATGKREYLGRLGIRRADISVPSGLPERALELRAGTREDGAHTLLLSLKGQPYDHEILLPGGTRVIDVDWNDERAYFILSDDTEHVIDVKTLESLMFNTAIPVFHLGVRKPLGFKVDAIQFVRRRAVATDKSNKALAAERLDLNPGTLKHAIRNASDEVVASLKEKLAELDLPPLHPILHAQLVTQILASRQKAGAPQESELTAEQAENLILNSLQLAEIAETSEGRQVVGIQRRIATDAMIALQDSALLGMQHIASPNSLEDLKEMQNLQDPAMKVITEILKSPEGLRFFSLDGLQESLSKIPAKVLQGIKSFAAAGVVRLADAEKNQTQDALYDRFSPAKLQEDLNYLTNEFVPNVEAAAAARASRSMLGNVTHDMVERVKDFNVRKRMNQLVVALRNMKGTALKAAGVGAIVATAAETDYLLNHGKNVAMVLSTISGMWSYMVTNYTPVFTDMSYLGNMLWYSDSARILGMAAIIGVALVAKRWSQYGANKLIAITGIKWLFSYPMLPPQIAFLWLTGRSGMHRAMKLGYAPGRMLLPFMPEFLGGSALPENQASLPWYQRAWNRLWESKNAFLDRKGSEIAMQERERALAGAVALLVYSEKHGLQPHEVLGKIAGDLVDAKTLEAQSDKKTFQELKNLKLAAIDAIRGGNAGEIADALQHEPAAFAAMTEKLKREVGTAADKGAAKYPGLLTAFRLQAGRSVLKRVANFGTSQYDAIANPMPSDAVSNYVVRNFLVDGAFTIAISSLAGEFAMLTEPNSLSYQPGQFLGFALPNHATGFPGAVANTHPIVAIGDAEQAFLHLGASAALTYMSSSEEAREAMFSTAAPAASLDISRQTGVRPWTKDAGSLIVGAFDWRTANPFQAFGRRSWFQCVTLLQGFFVVGMGLRLFTGVFDGSLFPDVGAIQSAWGDSAALQEYFQSYGNIWGNAIAQAAYGQTYFIFLAPFVYRWFWAVHQSLTENLERKLRSMGGEFADMHTRLAQALEHQDYALAQKAAQEIVELYSHKHRPVPQAVLDTLKPDPNVSVQEWAKRVLDACTEHAPAPERPNEIVNTGFSLIGSAVTTILASFLMNDSFKNRKFWGDGVSPDSQFMAPVNAHDTIVASGISQTWNGTATLINEAGRLVGADGTLVSPMTPGSDLVSRAYAGTWNTAASGVESAATATHAYDAAAAVGFDPATVNLWTGVSRADSQPAIIAKSLMNIVAVWFAGNVFNLTFDTVRKGYNRTMNYVRGSHNRFDTPAEKAALEAKLDANLAASWKGLPDVPVVRALLPTDKVDRSELATQQTACAAAVLSHTRTTDKSEEK